MTSRETAHLCELGRETLMTRSQGQAEITVGAGPTGECLSTGPDDPRDRVLSE